MGDAAPTPESGLFWRILPVSRLDHVLDGAAMPEGRFHHDGQPAIYLSPTPQAAAHAIAPYLRPGDPPRCAVPLRLTGAHLADLRDAAICRALGLCGDETAVPWRPERALGLPATTWRASDAARAAGYDGIRYAARSAPARWHIVLFRWNGTQGPQLRRDGAPLPFQPAPLSRPGPAGA